MVEIGNRDGARQLYFSGGLHGDERVGPHAVLEAAELLCSRYTGVDLTQTLLVMTPLTNAIGYFRGERGEKGRDPNRDFPFDQDPRACMQTVAARLVHRIFTHYGRISAGITFHGGDQSITYPWGSKSHVGELAPDQPSLHLIAKELQRVSGGPSVYRIGSMEEVVYPVNGGMEDWAYALGIEPTVFCEGESRQNGPQPQKLESAAIFLVETTWEKQPPESDLGSREEVWNIAIHSIIPRCVRMIFSLIKIVNPYLTVLPVTVGGAIRITTSGILAGSVRGYGSNCSFIDRKVDDTLMINVPGKELSMCELFVEEPLVQGGGHLTFMQNRTKRDIKVPPNSEDGICMQVGSEEEICVSSSFLVVDPELLLHRKSTVEIHLSDAIDPILLSSIHQVVTRLPSKLDSFEGVKINFSAPSLSRETTVGPLTVLLLLAVPVGIILCIIRRGKNSDFINIQSRPS